MPQLAFHVGIESWLSHDAYECEYRIFRRAEPETSWSIAWRAGGGCRDCARVFSTSPSNTLDDERLAFATAAAPGTGEVGGDGVDWEAFSETCAEERVPDYAGLSLGGTAGMLLLDMLLCCLLAWYLNQVGSGGVGWESSNGRGLVPRHLGSFRSRRRDRQRLTIVVRRPT